MPQGEHRLQQIDTLLRNESVDRLREVLLKSETELATKRSAVVALIGEAHPDVLRCATAISLIHSNCSQLIESTKSLKPLQSSIQSLLLSVGPIKRRLWTTIDQQENQKEGTKLSQWLNVCPSSWNVAFEEEADNTFQVTRGSEHELPTSDDVESRDIISEKLKRKKKVQRLAVCAYTELPRGVLEMLSHSKPLQGLCLLCGWGPRIRQRLTEITTDSSTLSEDKSHILSVLSRQRSYFSCHDLLNRAKTSARQSLSNPFPSPWLENSGSLELPPRCCCTFCKTLLQKFSYPGTSNLLEVLAAVVIVDPKDGESLQKEVLESRSHLMESLTKLDSDGTVSDEGLNIQGCELFKTCHPQLLCLPLEDSKIVERIIRLGYQLSCAIRVFEVTSDVLTILDNNRIETIQKIALEVFKPFCKEIEVGGKCDCHFCSLDKETVLHLWKDCSRSPVIPMDSEQYSQIVRKSFPQFDQMWRLHLCEVIEEALCKICAAVKINSLDVINGMWRSIYHLVLTDRLCWASMSPFGGIFSDSDSSSVTSAIHSTIDDFLRDPFLLATWQNTKEDLWTSSRNSLPLMPPTEDILIDVSRIFDKALDSIIKQETESAARGHLTSALSSPISSVDSLKALDNRIGLLILESERMTSSSYAWCRILGANPSSWLNTEVDLSSVKDLRTSSIGNSLLKRSTPLAKCSLIKSSLEIAFVEVAEEWFFSVVKSDTQLWGKNGWFLSSIAETLNIANDFSSTKFNGYDFLPFISWIFRVTSISATPIITPTICELRKVADACLYRWTLTSVQLSATYLAAAVTREIDSLSEESNQERSDESVSISNKLGWRNMTSPSGTEPAWRAPSAPLAALSTLLFEACSQFGRLRQSEEKLGTDSHIAVSHSASFSMKSALKDLIYCIYSSSIELHPPLTTTIQILFDLELSEVLLGGCIKLGDNLLRHKIVPTYLRSTKFNVESSLVELQERIRNECFKDMVDRLLYSSRNLRPIVLESIEGQLFLVSPLLSSETISSPLKDLHLKCTSNRFIEANYEASPPVAPVAVRLPLLPVTVHKSISSSSSSSFSQFPESMRLKIPPKLESRTPPFLSNSSTTHGESTSGLRALDYTSSAAAALKEMKDGFLGSTGANVAADLSSQAYKNVSSLSSFFSRHVHTTIDSLYHK